MTRTSGAMRLRLVGLLIALALVAVACGSSDDDSTSDSSSGSEETSTDTASAGEDEGTDDADDADESDESDSTEAGDGDAGEAPSGDPIIVGHTAGYTGFMSPFDIPVRQGIELAIADINADGGVLGRPLELVTSNNETDFAKIQTSALEVVEQGADFVVPSCDFDVGGPAARVANENGLLAIGCAGGPLFGLEGIGPLTFNTYHSSPVEGSVMAEFASDQGYEAPFVIIDQTLEYTQSIGESFILRWEELGGTIAGQDTMSSDDESIASQVAAAQSSGADVIMLASLPPQGPTALAQIRAAGIDLPILGTNAFDGVYWIDAIPDVSDFWIPVTASMYGDDPLDARNDFFVRLEEATGEPPASGNYPLSGYASVQAVALAMEMAGTTDSEAVREQLESFTDQELMVGLTTYSATCHIPAERPLIIIEYVDGQPGLFEERQVESVSPAKPC